jgi:hypothetical protein
MPIAISPAAQVSRSGVSTLRLWVRHWVTARYSLQIGAMGRGARWRVEISLGTLLIDACI